MLGATLTAPEQLGLRKTISHSKSNFGIRAIALLAARAVASLLAADLIRLYAFLATDGRSADTE
jgi:hypothetical protein